MRNESHPYIRWIPYIRERDREREGLPSILLLLLLQHSLHTAQTNLIPPPPASPSTIHRYTFFRIPHYHPSTSRFDFCFRTASSFLNYAHSVVLSYLILLLYNVKLLQMNTISFLFICLILSSHLEHPASRALEVPAVAVWNHLAPFNRGDRFFVQFIFRIIF